MHRAKVPWAFHHLAVGQGLRQGRPRTEQTAPRHRTELGQSQFSELLPFSPDTANRRCGKGE